MPLQTQHHLSLLEAGLDEAGRGCLAGPVVAAAVILPPDFHHPVLNDSKQLSAAKRDMLRQVVMDEAIAWAVAEIDHTRIDEVNILNASFEAMHRAVDGLHTRPQALLVDGNRFKHYPGLPHLCMVKGDGRFLNIAAASILAKTHRDAVMAQLHELHPEYGWLRNKGYPTQEHREAVAQYGLSPWHRRSFNSSIQYSLF